jgi:hypothetical protein
MNWCYFLLTMIGGGVFYALRCQCRFLYGIVEICIGGLVIYLVWNPAQTNYLLINEPAPYAELAKALGKAIGVVGGIYLLVRGLDNIDSDLPLVFRAKWDYIFRNSVLRWMLKQIARRVKWLADYLPPSLV